MAEIGSAFLSIMASARDVPGQIDKQVTPGLTKVGKRAGLSFGKLFAAGAALGLGAKAFDFLGDSIGEAQESAKVGALTANVIKTTGKAANISAKQVGKLATAISNKTGIDDEAIQSGSNLLLTFTKVANAGKGQAAIFDRATKAAVDLSASGFGDINGASKQLGKALQDPIKGISALGKSGVTFSEDQKVAIKAMVESNNILGAQKIILGEVDKQVKGAAAAQATAADKAAVAYGNLKEQVGTALLPVIERLATIATTKVIPAVSTFITQLQSGTGAGGFFAAAFERIRTVLGFVLEKAREFGGYLANEVYPAFRDKLSPIVDQTKDAFGRLAQKFQENKPELQALLGQLKEMGKAFLTKVLPAVYAFALKAIPILIDNIGFAISVLGGIVRAAYSTGRAIGDVAVVVIRTAERFKLFATSIRATVNDGIATLRALPGRIAAVLAGIPRLMTTIGGQITDGLARGVASGAGKVAAVVQRIVNAIPIKIRKIMGIASPSKVTTILGGYIGDGLAKGITSSEKKITKAIGKVLDKAKEKLTDRIDSFKALSSSVADNLTGSLFGNFETAGDFLANLNSVKGNLGAAIADFKTLKGFGLSGAFLAQLFADGGFPLIHELAADKATAQAAGSIFGDIQSLSGQLGSAVATATPDIGGGYTLADLNATLVEINKNLQKVPDGVAKGVNGAAAGGKKKGNKGGKKKR